MTIESTESDREHLSLDDFSFQLEALRKVQSNTESSLSGEQAEIDWQIADLKHSSPAEIKMTATDPGRGECSRARLRCLAQERNLRSCGHPGGKHASGRDEGGSVPGPSACGGYFERVSVYSSALPRSMRAACS